MKIRFEDRSLVIGEYVIAKECGGRWFPRAGYGYWDGMKCFLKKPFNLKFRTFPRGFAIGPLMIWKKSFQYRIVKHPNNVDNIIEYSLRDMMFTQEIFKKDTNA